MKTSDEFRSLLLRVLENPKDRDYGLALADWLDVHGYPRADVIRRDFREGCAYVSDYLSYCSPDGFPPVVDIVIQLIPQAVAIELACRCAEAELDSVEEIFPGDENCARVLQAIRAWSHGRQTKQSIARLRERLASLNEDETDKYELDPDDPDDAEELALIGKALCTVQAINWATSAVQYPANSSKWWQCVSGSLVESGYASGQKTKSWQRRELIRLVRERDLGLRH